MFKALRWVYEDAERGDKAFESRVVLQGKRLSREVGMANTSSKVINTRRPWAGNESKEIGCGGAREQKPHRWTSMNGGIEAKADGVV